jgi:hypothetical protein
MKIYIKIVLFIVSFIALSAILAAIYMYNLKHTDMAKARPDFIITSSLLQKAFEDDETAASAKYIDKILEVSGKIASVESADNSTVNIILLTENDLSGVSCTFPAISDPSKFSIGDEITLRGKCSGFLLDVQLKYCAVIRKRNNIRCK